PPKGQRSCLTRLRSPSRACRCRPPTPPETSSSGWDCSIPPARAARRSTTCRRTCCSTWPPCAARWRPRSTARSWPTRWPPTRSPRPSARRASGWPTAERAPKLSLARRPRPGGSERPDLVLQRLGLHDDVGRPIAQAIEEIADVHVQQIGQLPEHRGGHAVGRALVLLDLLEPDAQRHANVLLCQPHGLAPPAQALAQMDIYAFRHR